MTDLDAAWAEAEAALPEGRWVLSLTRPDRVDVTGWNVRAFDRDGGGYDPKARIRAFDLPQETSETDRRRAWRLIEDRARDYTVYAPTAAAALRALAAKLREVPA